MARRGNWVQITKPGIAAANTVYKILEANTQRRGLMLYNNTANSIYLVFGKNAGGADCNQIVASFANFNMMDKVYTGAIYASRNAGTTGTANIVEFCSDKGLGENQYGDLTV